MADPDGDPSGDGPSVPLTVYDGEVSESIDDSQIAEISADKADRSLAGRVYVHKTTFGKEPWWSDKRWWKLASSGEANDIRTHIGTFGDLAIAATSLRGNKHRLNGQVNEDSFAISTVTVEDGRQFLLVAVCDGMGSAAYSSFGARVAAHAVVSCLGALLHGSPDTYVEMLHTRTSDFLGYVTRSVCEYRDAEFDAPPVSKDAVDLNDLQTTLTFAIVPCVVADQAGETREVTIGIVGDSPAFRLSVGRGWIPIEPAKDNDGVWSSATAGLIGATDMLLTRVEMWPGDALLVSSDGVGNFLTFNGVDTPLGDDLARRWVQPVGMLDFVRDVAFEMPSADDDRTAVMVWIPGDRPWQR